MSPQEQIAARARFTSLLEEYFAAPRMPGRSEALSLHNKEVKNVEYHQEQRDQHGLPR
jgi:hypothetical protein